MRTSKYPSINKPRSQLQKRTLYFPVDFGKLTIGGLIDTEGFSSAIPEADIKKIQLLASQSIVKEGQCVQFSNYGRKRSIRLQKAPLN